MKKHPKSKLNYSAISLETAMGLIGRSSFSRWQLDVLPRPPSDVLNAVFQRLESFDVKSTEQGKTLLIDALFGEIVPLHPKLKVWKAATLNTDTLTGVAGYLIAPHRAYLATPLLCVTEAKRDDFDKGQAQCLAEMIACQWNNTQRGLDIEVYGIVSNGQGWQFYKLTQVNEIFETGLYTIEFLPQVLGILDWICAECAKNITEI